jgi:hypothetical protein
VKRPVKKAAAKKVAVKKTVAKKPRVASPDPQKPAPSGFLDKAIDVVKWVDSPFKLAVVILLGAFGLTGYLVYQNQEKLINKVINHDTMPTMVSDERIVGAAQALMRDLRAETIIVHEINLSSNARTTRVALSPDGRHAPLEGKKGAFFSGSPARNHAAISMLNGEVLCETFEPSSEAGDWIVSRGVTYACRGSIPPEQGTMVGYLAVGFKGPPRDIVAVRARINQTTRELAR